MSIAPSLALMPAEWRDRVKVPVLNDETHIWAIQLRGSPKYQKQQYQWLSSREKNKAKRMLIDVKRDYQIQARAWLRWLLAGYLGTSPKSIQYKYGPLGKPYLDQADKQIHFNTTDSGNTLLCAFSLEHRLGLDVEFTPRNVKFKQIAEKKYTLKEQALINSLPSSSQSNAFLAIWTRKEAFGKALGIGIRYPMNQYNLCENFDSYHSHTVDQQGSEWSLFQFNYLNNIACLVSQQKHNKIHFYKLDTNSVELT